MAARAVAGEALDMWIQGKLLLLLVALALLTLAVGGWALDALRYPFRLVAPAAGRT
jgi:hypothetical protein